MTQASPAMANNRPPLAQPQQHIGQQSHNINSQPTGYPRPGINQGPGSQTLPPQQLFERERELQEARERQAREREFEYMSRREREVRDRDARERQLREQVPHESHQEQILLHQPVAVGPQMGRAIHGPNGLLADGGSVGSRPLSPGPTNGHASLFGQQPGGSAQPAQAPMQNMAAFGNGAPNGHQMPLPPVGQGQGQQPILNVRPSWL